jgi:hypothetical protein
MLYVCVKLKAALGAPSVFWRLVVYAVVVARRLRLQNVYRPVFEDWLFHVLLPLVAYAMLAVSAYVARSNARPSLFLVGAAALLLLLWAFTMRGTPSLITSLRIKTSGNRKR